MGLKRTCVCTFTSCYATSSSFALALSFDATRLDEFPLQSFALPPLFDATLLEVPFHLHSCLVLG